MAPDFEEEEKERLSWREIDRIRDRSRHAPKEPLQGRRRSKRSEWLMKRYRKEADKLFMGKKGTREYQKAQEELDRAYGTERFGEIARAYLDQYGLPEDWRTLSLLLDHTDPEKVLEVLRTMRTLYETRSAAERQGFRSKLDIMAMTASHPEVREMAEEMLKSL
ncbi:MAG: hypothetical protein N3G78_10930 [Desulfobacterota bacterium]|nr:hypothetical protein [Thermodesulfobacteriota bacterium]